MCNQTSLSLPSLAARLWTPEAHADEEKPEELCWEVGAEAAQQPDVASEANDQQCAAAASSPASRRLSSSVSTFVFAVIF